MANWSEALAIEIVGAFSYFLLGGVALALFRFWRERRSTAFSDFTRISNKIKQITLIFGLVDPTPSRKMHSVEEGDISAICSGLLLLEERFGHKRVSVLSSHAAITQLGDFQNLISISGPIWNKVTARLLEALKVPIEFIEDNGRDCLKTNGINQRIYSTVYENSTARECYAIVCVGELEGFVNKQSRKVVIVAGVSALGTFGATAWLRQLTTRKTTANDSWSKIGKKNRICIILKVFDRSPDGFRAFASGPTRPAFLDFEVVETFVED